MKRDLFWLLAILIFIGAFGVWVFPTPYYYTQYGTESTSKIIVKINRLTGEADMLMPDGWVKMQKKK